MELIILLVRYFSSSVLKEYVEVIFSNTRLRRKTGEVIFEKI